MTKFFIENENGELKEVDLGTWARWFSKANRRIAIAFTKEYKISTVCMGIAQNFDDEGKPLVYETMVFDKLGNDVYSEQYATKQEALIGFHKVIQWVRDGCKQPE